MSRQKLTIIVTCTDRKSATPDDELMVRNLPTGQVSARARVWREAPRASDGTPPPHRPVQRRDMESGSCTCTQGHEPRVRTDDVRGVGRTRASARFRLRLPPTPRRSARVTPTRSARPFPSLGLGGAHSPMPTSAPGGRAIWVLSEAYSRVVSQQLLEDTAPSDFWCSADQRRSATACASPRTDHFGVRSEARSPASTFAPQRSGCSLSDGEDPFTSAARDSVARLVAREAASRGL